MVEATVHVVIYVWQLLIMSQIWAKLCIYESAGLHSTYKDADSQFDSHGDVRQAEPVMTSATQWLPQDSDTDTASDCEMYRLVRRLIQVHITGMLFIVN